jgi:16S rRNA G966 N2-methylase RsmD
LLDPPFNQEYEIKLLKLLSRKNDIKPSCKIYLEHSKFTEVKVPEDFEILKNKIVGDVRALLLEKK